MWLREDDSHDGAQSNYPRVRKFLLIEDGDKLVVVAGPHFTWPMEYHHVLLRNKYFGEHGKSCRCLGGGVLFAECNQRGGYSAQLGFWKSCVCGQYNDELADHTQELADALRCEVSITVE